MVPTVLGIRLPSMGRFHCRKRFIVCKPDISVVTGQYRVEPVLPAFFRGGKG
jgi:hypothetical protein